MSLLCRLRNTLPVFGFVSCFSAVFLAAGSSEFPLIESLPGSQVSASIAVSPLGGYVVWQDGTSGGKGLGISARKLDDQLTATGENFRVSAQTLGDRQNAKVAMLPGGAGLFVWQGGKPGSQDIFGRVRSSDGRWLTHEFFVNTFRRFDQVDPALAVLTNGNAIVTWSSFRQDGSFYGVFAQRIGKSGQRLGKEFPVNVYTNLNQHNSAVAALANGGFVVTWISGAQRSQASLDVYARLFDASGRAMGDEFPVNVAGTSCSLPEVAGVPDGFVVTWTQKEGASRETDVFARAFNAAGTSLTDAFRVNTHVQDDQFSSRIAAWDTGYLIVWTSMLQDGYWEGIFAQRFNPDHSPDGSEFQVNDTAYYRQIDPAVSMTPSGKGLIVWSHYVLGGPAFDLFGKRFH